MDGENAGQYKRVDKLTFLRVYDAGHMVPMDQPARSLEMLRQFMMGDFLEKRASKENTNFVKTIQ